MSEKQPQPGAGWVMKRKTGSKFCSPLCIKQECIKKECVATPREVLSSDEEDEDFSLKPVKKENEAGSPVADTSNESYRVTAAKAIEGIAVWCLPPETSWFQGQFLRLDGRGSAVGMLAHELEIDECMECSFQGYGRYRLELINSKADKKIDVVVEKKGGTNISLRTERIGDPSPKEALQMLIYETTNVEIEGSSKHLEAMHRYFPSIVKAVKGDLSVLEQCVVCSGAMAISSHLLETIGAL